MSQGSDYRLRLHMEWIDETSPPAKKAKRGLDGVAKAAKAMFGAAIVRQGVKFATELTKIGATAERQANALNNLAAAAGESGTEIISAIQGAADFTIDKMSAMAAANRAMVMDVAKSPDEFERLTKVAVALGRAMGVDAVKSIDDFITAGGRQSKLIADNLGLVVVAEDAYKRYAEANNIAVDEMDDAAKKQAFLTEMLRQGEIKMADLGEQTLDNAGKMEQASASWADAKMAMGEIAVNIVSATGALEDFSTGMQTFASRTEELGGMKLSWDAVRMAMIESFVTGKTGNEVYEEMIRNSVKFTTSLEEQKAAHYFVEQAVREELTVMDQLSYVSDETKDSLNDQITSQGMLMHTVLNAASAIGQEVEAVDELVRGIDAATSLRLSMQFTSQFQSQEEAAAGFAKTREDIEAEHQEKMAAIRRRGQSVAIRFDEQAEQAELAQLQRNLEIAVQSESELTDKTKQSTRMRSEDRISRLQGQITEQETLLDDYNAGRLVKAGENTTALIAEENRRKEAAIAALDEQMAKQQEVQEQAMGNMMLNAFDMWAQTKDIPEEQKDEWVKRTVEMRTGIAEEYGLVAQGSADLVADMVDEWDNWATGTGASTEEVIGYLDNVIDATGDVREELLELTAETYWIRVRFDYEGQGPPEAYNPPGGDPGSTQGAGRPGNIINSSDTYNFNTPHGPAAVLEAQRRQRRRTMGRVM